MHTALLPDQPVSVVRRQPYRRFVSPTVDYGFWRIFGAQPRLLRSFLNALLPLPAGDPIDSLEYLAPAQVPDIPGLFRPSLIDVLCTARSGRVFIADVRMIWSSLHERRMVFGESEVWLKPLSATQHYSTPHPVYALTIITSNFLPVMRGDAGSYLHHFKTVRLESSQEKLDGLEFVYVELPKFKLASHDPAKRLQTLWLRFLSETGQEERQIVDPAFMAEGEIAEAFDLVDEDFFTDAELGGYAKQLDATRTDASMLVDAINEGQMPLLVNVRIDTTGGAMQPVI